MRILGIAGLVLGLAIVGYLVVSYLHGGRSVPETFRTILGTPSASGPVDPTKKGLERRLAPILDRERQRVEETNKAMNQR